MRSTKQSFNLNKQEEAVDSFGVSFGQKLTVENRIVRERKSYLFVNFCRIAHKCLATSKYIICC